MSSIGSSLYQTPFKGSVFTAWGTPTLHVVNSGASVSAVMTTSEFDAATTYISLLSGNVFKDMGKTIVTVNSQGMHTDKYQLVQLMDGNSRDSIEGTSQVVGYLRVWSTYSPTAGGRVAIARTG